MALLYVQMTLYRYPFDEMKISSLTMTWLPVRDKAKPSLSITVLGVSKSSRFRSHTASIFGLPWRT